MLAHNNSAPVWFADLPAWEGNETRPAQLLAEALVTQGVTEPPTDDRYPDSDTVAAPGLDEWGWLGADDDPLASVDDGGAAVAASDVEPRIDESPEDGWGSAVTEPIADHVRAPRRARRKVRGDSRRWWPAAVAVVVAALVVLGVWAAVSDTQDAPSAHTAAPLPVSAVPSSTPADDCPSETIGAVTTGRDAGDQNSGPGVIKAFNYAYYRLRDARAAQSFTAKSAGLNPVEMQGFIDRRPVGTSYCLEITDRGSGLYAVQLTETPPDGGAPTVFSQLIQTTQTSGKTWIATNRPA